MIDRTNRVVPCVNKAELTGLVPQLTTPSRNRSDLVDIWFGVHWNERDPAWEESFQRLANGRRPDASTPSFFGLFSHAASSGLIVARQVSADRATWKAIEEEARTLIDLVNGDVAQQRSPSVAAPAPGRRAWTLRVLDATSYLTSLKWLGDEKTNRPFASELPVQVSHSAPSGTR